MSKSEKHGNCILQKMLGQKSPDSVHITLTCSRHWTPQTSRSALRLTTCCSDTICQSRDTELGTEEEGPWVTIRLCTDYLLFRYHLPEQGHRVGNWGGGTLSHYQTLHRDGLHSRKNKSHKAIPHVQDVFGVDLNPQRCVAKYYHIWNYDTNKVKWGTWT
jgi:hypothetical protein